MSDECFGFDDGVSVLDLSSFLCELLLSDFGVAGFIDEGVDFECLSLLVFGLGEELGELESEKILVVN